MDPKFIVYNGEAQLLAWSNTHNAGPKITVALPNEEALDRFKALTLKSGKQAGQRLALAVVAVGDDEKPIVQELVPSREVLGMGVLAKTAAMMCANPDFQRWLVRTFPTIAEEVASEGQSTTELSAEIVRSVCCVGSRAELDTNDIAATIFHTKVRKPYYSSLTGGHSA
jgi:hypothetical protein